MTSIKFRALTHDDYKLFFEALGEFGKDFQNIQQYITQKGNKGKSDQSSSNNKSIDQQERRDQDKKDEDKKREQIRNFYNKLYTKLSQLIGRLDDRVEKVYQELYLLINYGEIWKKHGFMFNNKTKRLLEDLIYQGSTTLRFKNKNVRLRTPACKALKKINEIGIDEKVKVVTTRELPKDVIIEFHPATNRDWLKVQSISQNPRVRARLPIQKRLTNILKFMESKWNISQDKLNLTVDSWLKIDAKNQTVNFDDLTSNQQQLSHQTNKNIDNNRSHVNPSIPSFSSNSDSNHSAGRTHQRLRLKPSSHHELKEVNITRVVPDNHLDLSLNAYIKRLANINQTSTEHSIQPPQGAAKNGVATSSDNHESHSDGCPRLPVSLTTPDCSILFEKSCTSDQPSIAQARKHLNLLQSLAGVLDGCENSRTVNEDTQDRSLLNVIGGHTKNLGFSLDQYEDQSGQNPASLVDIPALYDENAALPASENAMVNKSSTTQEAGSSNQHPAFDAQNSKSVEFSIPKNVTLGDYFKMTSEKVNESDIIHTDETANDSFPIAIDLVPNDAVATSGDRVNRDQQHSPKETPGAQNHLVDIKRLAEGWTRFDDANMTIGELYLALKCPVKIILEYTFEEWRSEDNEHSTRLETDQERTDVTIVEEPSDDRLIFKLLTAASLSLAKIERQKEEQQLRSNDQQSCSKLKRRKISPGTHGHNKLTLHDIEATNQRVEEELKQLQPTRLYSCRRAR